MIKVNAFNPSATSVAFGNQQHKPLTGMQSSVGRVGEELVQTKPSFVRNMIEGGKKAFNRAAFWSMMGLSVGGIGASTLVTSCSKGSGIIEVVDPPVKPPVTPPAAKKLSVAHKTFMKYFDTMHGSATTNKSASTEGTAVVDTFKYTVGGREYEEVYDYADTSKVVAKVTTRNPSQGNRIEDLEIQTTTIENGVPTVKTIAPVDKLAWDAQKWETAPTIVTRKIDLADGKVISYDNGVASLKFFPDGKWQVIEKFMNQEGSYVLDILKRTPKNL